MARRVGKSFRSLSRGSVAKPIVRRRRNSGNITLNSATWAEVAAATGGPGVGGLDLVVPAVAGDTIQINVSMSLANVGSTRHLRFDVWSMVAGARVNQAGSTGGWPGWLNFDFSGGSYGYLPVTSSAWFVVQTADIVSGAVTLRLHYIQTSFAGDRVLSADVDFPMDLLAVNLGQ